MIHPPPSRLTTTQAAPGAVLDAAAVRATLETALAGQFTGARLLVLIPDHTRTAPLPLLFRLLAEILHDARALDVMVALGTHPPLDDPALNKLVGVTARQRNGEYAHIGLLNHAWDDPGALRQIGTIARDQVQAIAGDLWHPSLGGDVPVRINRAVFEYDHLLIVCPTFPHEVVGFSGGTKYLFPGIGAAEMINVTHWLGALATILNTIGVADTPVRALIDAAADLLTVPMTAIALVITAHEHTPDAIAGMFIGEVREAWRAAAALSAERHITWVDRPYQRVLSFAPPMYDELWTAAKAMYKLEPAIADGGEVIVYAPHLDTVSHVHGAYIAQAGYHVRDYYLGQWERFGHLPLGVLAHGTHLRGSGTYLDGVERARITVTLASRIARAETEALGLTYHDPSAIDPEAWRGRESDGVLYVPKAGEMLYRVR
jgi:lactate racemase